MDKELPSLTQFLTLIELPTFPHAKRLAQDPIRATPYSDSAEPRRAMLRMLIELPRCMKSSAESEDPILDNP